MVCSRFPDPLNYFLLSCNHLWKVLIIFAPQNLGNCYWLFFNLDPKYLLNALPHHRHLLGLIEPNHFNGLNLATEFTIIREFIHLVPGSN
jgi:hypothetical protein